MAEQALEEAVAMEQAKRGPGYNYGVRTMVATPDAFYLGMANPINLATDPEDGRPDGGGELLELTERSRPPGRLPVR